MPGYHGKKGGIVPGKGKRRGSMKPKATKGKAGAYEPLTPKKGPLGLMEG